MYFFKNSTEKLDFDFFVGTIGDSLNSLDISIGVST